MLTEEQIKKRKELLLNKRKCPKAKFQTKEIAVHNLKRLNEKNHLGLTGVYLCTNCKNWHMTSTSKNRIIHFRKFKKKGFKTKTK